MQKLNDAESLSVYQDCRYDKFVQIKVSHTFYLKDWNFHISVNSAARVLWIIIYCLIQEKINKKIVALCFYFAVGVLKLSITKDET